MSEVEWSTRTTAARVEGLRVKIDELGDRYRWSVFCKLDWMSLYVSSDGYYDTLEKAQIGGANAAVKLHALGCVDR